MASRATDRQIHPVEAFRVDPDWYARYWLDAAPERTPGLARRALSTGWAVLTLALQSARNSAARGGVRPSTRLAHTLPK